jgi:inorganic triphosphatase YgiF
MPRKALTAAEKAARASQPKTKGPTLEEKLAAAQAQADAGDEGMQALMPAIDVYAEKLRQAKSDIRTAAKKLRKLLSA